jgi:CRISPR type I-E-associated protein CasB/Cse2
VTEPPNPADALRAALRDVRARYDRLSRGATAPLRRCEVADALKFHRTFYRLADGLERQEHHLHHVVLHFPLARQVRAPKPHWNFGTHLRNTIGESTTGQRRFTALLECRDREELDRHVRDLLKQSCPGGLPAVDWGCLGLDILWFFAASNRVKLRIAQGFYAPMADIHTNPDPDAESE